MDYREEIRNQRDENVRTKRGIARLRNYMTTKLGFDELLLDAIVAGKPVDLKTSEMVMGSGVTLTGDDDGEELTGEKQGSGSGEGTGATAPEVAGHDGDTSDTEAAEESDPEAEQAGEDQTDERPEATES